MSQSQRIPEERLTAFVMGELSGEERASIEAAMATDPALRAEVEELRSFCGQLWDELKDEPSPPLSLAEQAAFVRRLESESSRRVAKHRYWLAAAAPLAAAAIAAIIVWPRLGRPKLTDVQELVNGRDASNAAEEVRFEAAPEESLAETVPPAATQGDAKPETPPAELKKKVPAASTSQFKLAPSGGPALSGKNGPSMRGFGGAGSGGIGAMAKADGRAAPAPAKRKEMSLSNDFVGDMGSDEEFDTEAYDLIRDNPFHAVGVDPLSTFSVDVDTASYANMRRFINGGSLPPKDAVRIEEMLNYFRYDYPAPAADRPFSVAVEVTEAPWQTKHRLVRVGIKGKDIVWSERPTSNLVFLVDVSGSMNAPNKLPLVKEALKLLVDQFGEKDRVAIVVYAGSSGLVLPSTAASDKQVIMDALERLEAGGSTNGGEGLKLAYATAETHFVKGGVNRVVIATDGDFNVGTTSQGELIRLIEEKAKSGVFLSVLGFGMGNFKDATLEKLADKGNGNYGYIDSVAEARKALVEEAGGTLVTIAKDVKLQVEFNPEQVTAYRLIGYENRVLAHQDFNNDAKDAGDIGAGHVVTALYEVVPKGVPFKIDGVDALKYQKPALATSGSGEMLTLKLRYKKPDASKSSLIEYAVKDKGLTLGEASSDTRFAAGVAAFGMLLRDSEYKGTANYDATLKLLEGNLGNDAGGYRKELVELVKKAKSLKR